MQSIGRAAYFRFPVLSILCGLISGIWRAEAFSIPGITRRSSDFKCPSDFGNFPDPYSCEAYWICSQKNPLAASCSFGLIFSHKTYNCDWAKPEICTVIDGKVIRDWVPATIPPLPAAEKAKLDKIEIAVDKGYNLLYKAKFMTYKEEVGDNPDDDITHNIMLRFNITRKGTPKTVFEQYQMLVAKWKKQQKLLEALGYTTTKAPVTTAREAPLFGPDNYVLPDTVTPAPKKTYTIKRVGDAPIPCVEKRCRLPECYCEANNIPNNLSPKETPQIVMVTFDDAVNGGNIDLMDKVFSSKRLNPNGCPVTGTFFLSNQWTDYKLVRYLARHGHEIASHSLTHQDMSRYTYQQWRNEMVGEVELAEELAGVNTSQIYGMRAPFLNIGGDVQFRMLWDNGFLYDSSIPSSQTNPPLWPYTFDAPMPHPCFQEPCPKGYFPGLWEVPLTYFHGLNNVSCSMYDVCAFPSYSEEIADLFWQNFLRHYNTNRAPYLLSAHTAWYLNSLQRGEGLTMFMDKALKLGDVYFVSVIKALDWVRQPTPLSKVNTFPSWMCEKPEPVTMAPPPLTTVTQPPPATAAVQQIVQEVFTQAAVTTATTTTATTTTTVTAPKTRATTKAAAETRRKRRRNTKRRTTATTATTTTTLPDSEYYDDAELAAAPK